MGIVLEYQSRVGRRFPWRKVLKYLVRALVVGAIGAVAWVMMARFVRYFEARAEARRRMDACLNYSPAANEVVFRCNPPGTLALWLRKWRWGDEVDAPAAVVMFGSAWASRGRPYPNWPGAWNYWWQDSRNPQCWGAFMDRPRPREALIGGDTRRVRCLPGVRRLPHWPMQSVDLRRGDSFNWDYSGRLSEQTPPAPEAAPRPYVREPMLFMHRRTSRSGTERLVIVALDGPAFACGFERVFYVYVRSIDPGEMHFTNTMRMSCEGFPTDWYPPVVIYAGQADPADGARFYIPFEAGAKKYRIEGRLEAGDRVPLVAKEVGR